MNLGDCFVPRGGVNEHLHVVISDPAKDPARVLLVTVTTAAEYKEQTCLISANEHPWVRHLSCISYRHASFATNAALEHLRANALLEMHPPFPDLLLKRIWAGAADSTELVDKFADLLIEQGFLDV